jgi:hypothetical protein
LTLVPRLRLGLSLAACLAAACVVAPATQASGGLAIKVLSDRADVISAGNALVAVDLGGGVRPSSVVVTLDGRNVTDRFAVRQNGRFEGLVTGLKQGANVLQASLPGGSNDQVTLTNHPNGGPVTSGPQIQPWVPER